MVYFFRAEVQRAVMARARLKMMEMLHDTVDDLAFKAAADQRLLAARVAKALRRALPRERAGALDEALERAGISDDESQYVAGAEERMGTVVDRHEPDLTGIVDPRTGQVIPAR